MRGLKFVLRGGCERVRRVGSSWFIAVAFSGFTFFNCYPENRVRVQW